MPPLPPAIGGPSLHWNAGAEKSDHYPPCWFKMTYAGKSLLYTVEIVGSKTRPAQGYPLYICWHGGGSDTDDSNSDAWKGVASKYGYAWPIKAVHGATGKDGAIVICPRGIDNTWNLHFMDESYVLIERLVKNFIATTPPELAVLAGNASRANADLSSYDIRSPKGPFVNPNKVVLWGFSAGGDGAFQHAPRLADLFSAVVAAAGHPWIIRYDSTANLKFVMQVGEDDDHANRDHNHAFQRAEEYLKHGFAPLESLKHLTDRGYTANDGLYDYTLHVVHNAARRPDKDSSVQETRNGYPEGCHNWYCFDTQEQQVLKTDATSVADWLKEMAALSEAIRKPREEAHAKLRADGVSENGADAWKWEWPKFWREVQYSSYEPKQINPASFLEAVVRNPLPEFVVWDLAFRPPKPAQAPDNGWEKRFFYWMYLRQPLPKETQAEMDYLWMSAEDRAKHSDGKPYRTEVARLTKADLSLRVDKPTTYLAYLLKSEWLGKAVNVYENKAQQGQQPKWEHVIGSPITISSAYAKAIEAETLKLRGDANYSFSAMMYLERQGASADGKWAVKQATSFDGY